MLLVVVAAVVGGSDSPDDSAEAGPPFSIGAQQDLLGLNIDQQVVTDPGAPRCEVMAQIVQHLLRNTPGNQTVTAEGAAATAGPSGSLRVTVDQVSSDQEVSDAIGECQSFYIGLSG